MRKLRRPALPAEVQETLRTWQAGVDPHDNSKRRERWKGRKKTETIKTVRATLVQMSGGIERCMYCENTVSGGIEHFQPISLPPHRVYDWSNHLYACDRCNSSYKREKFFDAQGQRLFIDPSDAEGNPAAHLALSSTGRMIGLDALGSSTIRELGLNDGLLPRVRDIAWRVFEDKIIRFSHAESEDERLTVREDVRSLPFPAVFLAILDDALHSPAPALSEACVAAVRLHHATFRSWLT